MTAKQIISLHDAGAVADAQHADAERDRPCMSRRQFLLTGSAAVTVVALSAAPGRAEGQTQFALKAVYPRQRIGRLSVLVTGKPVQFNYPYPTVQNVLVKLGAPAGGGIGPELDVVAFNLQCTHMGGPMHGTYKAEHQVLGPCPLHLTTFDLTRHGMVVAGHGTESLPQIVLEAAGDEIYATAVLGLIYGYAHNVTGARRA